MLGSVAPSKTFELSNPNANTRSSRLLRIFKYLAVPSSHVSYCKYLWLTLCHGGGREFESRRHRHSFQTTCTGSAQTIVDPKGHIFVPFFVSLLSPAFSRRVAFLTLQGHLITTIATFHSLHTKTPGTRPLPERLGECISSEILLPRQA